MPINTTVISSSRSRRSGKLSVSAESYLKEQFDPNFRNEMERARSTLVNDMPEMGNAFAKLRLQRGYSQTALAAAVGTSQSHIAKIEAKSLDVKFSTAIKIADVLAVSLDQLRPLLTIRVAEPTQEHNYQLVAS